MEPSWWCDNEVGLRPSDLLVGLMTVSAKMISRVGLRGRAAVRSCGSFGGARHPFSGHSERAQCLRQYFPKGTDLAAHTTRDLAAVPAEVNSRPRKTLDWETPAGRLARLLVTAS
ncbi:hypothetical protein GCM10010446_04640 [Streptomyces enissocaesilis]|uniref:Transposase n=1 Tax=Streptomyces enissocaesilis TaxID=332589 RepID=A0ABP6J6K6_9ACTN